MTYKVAASLSASMSFNIEANNDEEAIRLAKEALENMIIKGTTTNPQNITAEIYVDNSDLEYLEDENSNEIEV